jgi:hypothetical protein
MEHLYNKMGTYQTFDVSEPHQMVRRYGEQASKLKLLEEEARKLEERQLEL